MKLTSAKMSPLLASEMQFEKLLTLHARDAINELDVRNIAANPKDGMLKLLALIKENEHPHWIGRKHY